MVYLPAFSRVKEKNSAGIYEERLLLIHTFMIPFLGKGVMANAPGSVKNKSIEFTDQNILKDKIILPFLQELIEKIPALSSYEALRHFLLTGKIKNDTGEEQKVEISIPNYLPTFIHGINSADQNTVADILTNKTFGFGFTANEVKANPEILGDYSITKAYHNSNSNSLLAIPAPISSRVQVVDKNGNRLGGYDPANPTSHLDFDITLDWLVADENGNHQVSKNIGKNTLTKEDKDFIDTYYDGYKTQFIKQKSAAFEQELFEVYDKRDDIMIPEFFKLAALLTVERFHQFATSEYKKFDGVNFKESETLNPFITITGTQEQFNLEFGYRYDYWITNTSGEREKKTIPAGTKWSGADINSELENVAGQLNYFYNNGLRLPLNDKIAETKSIYEFVNQYNIINLKNPIPTPDPALISVTLAGQNITDDVFATLGDKTCMWKFIEGFKPDNFFDNLKNEFIRRNGAGNPLPDPLIEIIKPYELIPVTLSIPNSKQVITKAGNNLGRFFELPAKLAQHATPGQSYSFRLNNADYKKQDSNGMDMSQEIINFSKCLNIEVKVKRHEVDEISKKSKILEINNVYVDDLNLMYSLFKDGIDVGEIDFYYKSEKVLDPSKKLIEVVQLNQIFATVLKTNLSPRTSPPIFAAKTHNFKNVNGETKYLADSNKNKKDFIRLLWEGLTTNNGGYYIIIDNDEIPKFKNEKDEIIDTGTIIVSFTAASKDQMPGYFNSLKIDQDENVFNGLDDKSHYLFINNLKLDTEKICEYHPLMPAHTFGFELKRDRSINPSSNYQNYLPLEFELFELDANDKPLKLPILSSDNVLPLMPTSELDNNKKPIPDKYIYNHLTPLKIQQPDQGIENWDRYDSIGKSYNLNVNVRDVFGFRTSDANTSIATQKYTHYYFDKIIPIESWPLVSFSYWLSSESKIDNLLFDLSCNHNILEIQNLAGIPLENGKFKYGLNSPIDNATHRELLKKVIEDFFRQHECHYRTVERQEFKRTDRKPRWACTRFKK